MQRIPELHDAVQDLSEAFGRRLVVLDRTMRVVAYSIHESPEDRRRLSAVLAHSDSWDTPATAHEAGVVQSVEGIGNALMYRLLGGDRHIVGHLMLAPLEDALGAGGLAALVASFAGPRVERISRLLEAWDAAMAAAVDQSASLAVGLVSPDEERRSAAGAALLSEGFFGGAERYCAVAVGPGTLEATPAGRSRVELSVAQTLRFVDETSTASVIGGVTPEGQGVLVFPRPVVAPRLARILTRPHLSPARAGIGPLAPLDGLHDSYLRAGWALRATTLAPDDHPVVAHWSETGVDGMLAAAPVERFTVDDLPEPVRRLLQDRHTRRWVPTLEVLLASAGDIQQAASDLALHRSTVYYRLERLSEVAGTDLRRGEVLRELHVGLRVARLAGLL